MSLSNLSAPNAREMLQNASTKAKINTGAKLGALGYNLIHINQGWDSFRGAAGNVQTIAGVTEKVTSKVAPKALSSLSKGAKIGGGAAGAVAAYFSIRDIVETFKTGEFGASAGGNAAMIGMMGLSAYGAVAGVGVAATMAGSLFGSAALSAIGATAASGVGIVVAAGIACAMVASAWYKGLAAKSTKQGR